MRFLLGLAFLKAQIIFPGHALSANSCLQSMHPEFLVETLCRFPELENIVDAKRMTIPISILVRLEQSCRPIIFFHCTETGANSECGSDSQKCSCVDLEQ